MTRFFRRVFVLAGMFMVLAAPSLADDVVQLTFPVDGPYHPSYDTFGDCRGVDCSRSHEGVDILADKMTPVVAAANGFVTVVRGLDPEGLPVENSHQWLVIQHDGWQSRYLHLNNDTEGTDDGFGYGIAEDIVSAYVAAGGNLTYPVSAGQLIGWMGDSGNAEDTLPHLHFELRIGEDWDSVPIDPYPALQALEFVPRLPWNGFFADDDDSVHESDIDKLAADGTTKGCNPPSNTNYCPQRLISRGEIAAFIRRTLDLPSAGDDFFTDDVHSVFEDDINAVTAAGIGFGCTHTEFCPDQPLLRDEMAEMLVRAFAGDHPELYANPDGTDFFVDDAGNRFEESINLLMAAQVTRGCNPPDNDRYCPDRPLIRAEMASFFVRALGR